MWCTVQVHRNSIRFDFCWWFEAFYYGGGRGGEAKPFVWKRYVWASWTAEWNFDILHLIMSNTSAFNVEYKILTRNENYVAQHTHITNRPKSVELNVLRLYAYVQQRPANSILKWTKINGNDVWFKAIAFSIVHRELYLYRFLSYTSKSRTTFEWMGILKFQQCPSKSVHTNTQVENHK